MTRLRDVNIKRPIDRYGNLRVENSSPQISLNAFAGLSVIRDIQTVTNSAAIQTVGGEHELSTGTTTGSLARLDTVERGRYQSGFSARAGIGIRLDRATLTGTQYAQFGYLDNDDGYGFGIDATGIFSFIRKNATDTKTYQSAWLIDKLDGTTQYSALSITSGTIFQVSFSYYGYGQIGWDIIDTNVQSLQETVTVHYVVPDGEVSIDSPNQPLRAEVSNGNTTDNIKLFVAGRQFAVEGRYQPDLRVTADKRFSITVSNSVFTPLISFRVKSATAKRSVRAAGFDIGTNSKLEYAVYIGGTLTGASWQAPTDVPASETSVESDISATAIGTPDTVLARGLVPTTGTGNQAIGEKTNDALGFNIPENNTVTLVARSTNGSPATVDAVFRVTEEW